MQDASWWHKQCLTEKPERDNHHQQASKLRNRAGRGRERHADWTENPDWWMDRKGPVTAPIRQFAIKWLSCFYVFFYRSWPGRTQGTSQTWCWIRLDGNQRRTGHKLEGTPATSEWWARLIWCSTVSRLSFWCLKIISWSVKGNVLRWLPPHSTILASWLMHMCPQPEKIPKLRRLRDHWGFSETSMYPCWSPPPLSISLSLSSCSELLFFSRPALLGILFIL